MKRVLITGANSYVGTSVEKWLMKEPNNYYVETLDMKDPSWRDFDFSRFDVVFHVAGVAHLKENGKNRLNFFYVNRDLAYEVAKYSNEMGIKHFIFMSSMSVYGVDSGMIDSNIIENPKSAYGQSKLQGEKLISKLTSKNFKISIVRPPMIYGNNGVGNYLILRNFALMIPIFPNINNQRSMIYINNFAEFIKHVIDLEYTGILLPQNNDYVKTSELVKKIRDCHGKKTILVSFFNPIIKLLMYGKIKKIFSSLSYSKAESHFNLNYNIYNFEESIEFTELGSKS